MHTPLFMFYIDVLFLKIIMTCGLCVIFADEYNDPNV